MEKVRISGMNRVLCTYLDLAHYAEEKQHDGACDLHSDPPRDRICGGMNRKHVLIKVYGMVSRALSGTLPFIRTPDVQPKFF